jgi:hypothetical protein
MAGRIAGRRSPLADLPIDGSPLEHPNRPGRIRAPAFAPFRRLGQRMPYRGDATEDARG